MPEVAIGQIQRAVAVLLWMDAPVLLLDGMSVMSPRAVLGCGQSGGAQAVDEGDGFTGLPGGPPQQRRTGREQHAQQADALRGADHPRPHLEQRRVKALHATHARSRPFSEKHPVHGGARHQSSCRLHNSDRFGHVPAQTSPEPCHRQRYTRHKSIHNVPAPGHRCLRCAPAPRTVPG